MRSTRSPTYHEEEDEDVKVPAKKRRTVLKSKAEGAVEELRFERVSGEEAVVEVRTLFTQMFMRQPGAKMEVHLSDVKMRTKNVVAWFSSFAPAQQHYVLSFFLLLSFFQWVMVGEAMISVNVIREYALQVIALLKKKLERHHPEKTFDEFLGEEMQREDWNDVRQEQLNKIASILPDPEYALLSTALEQNAFLFDPTLGDLYVAKCDSYCKALNEKEKDDVISGECSLLELVWLVCWRNGYSFVSSL